MKYYNAVISPKITSNDALTVTSSTDRNYQKSVPISNMPAMIHANQIITACPSIKSNQSAMRNKNLNSIDERDPAAQTIVDRLRRHYIHKMSVTVVYKSILRRSRTL